ncbi:MAG: hypothetical protein IPI89_09005 [Propionivibrio sp.]|nr:hypothetical protein [Propionivibrio sp.]
MNGYPASAGSDRHHRDDATNEQYSMFFVRREGTASSLRGVGEVDRIPGAVFAFYWIVAAITGIRLKPAAKVEQQRPATQFGHALRKRLGHRDDSRLFPRGARALGADVPRTIRIGYRANWH